VAVANTSTRPCAYHMIAQKGFSEEYPEARELLAGVFLPLEENAAINLAVNNGQTMDKAIQDWIDTHQDRLKRWENIKRY
jgi:glycine betaine/proline transport system substrate-binding protein